MCWQCIVTHNSVTIPFSEQQNLVDINLFYSQSRDIVLMFLIYEKRIFKQFPTGKLNKIGKATTVSENNILRIIKESRITKE